MRMPTIVIAALLAFGTAAGAEERPPSLTVSGEGRVTAIPDMAVISLGVTSEARTAAQAVSDNSDTMAGVLARLVALGLAERDIQTSNFNVSPIWDRNYSGQGPRRITGFSASNQLTLRVRDLDMLGSLLDDVLNEGANTFGGLRFTVQEQGPLRDEARKLAVSEARRKAALYAEATGVTLGPLLSLSEFDGGGPQPMARMEAALAADSVPIAGGELSISANVTLVYGIAD